MNLIFRTLLNQYRINSWLGASKDLFSRSLFYLTPINLIMLSATTYQVTAKDYILVVAPWFNFPMFLGLLVLFTLCAMVFEYKVVYPSSLLFINRQTYKHGNLVKRDLEVLSDQIQRIENKLDTITKKSKERG